MTTEKIRNRARKSKAVAALLGLFLSPVAYIYVGKWAWAIVNLLTINFLLLGFVIVPIHTYYSIVMAQNEVENEEKDVSVDESIPGE